MQFLDLRDVSRQDTAEPEPEITVRPNKDAASDNAALRFLQTTYWSCVTSPVTVHCGWHEPILDANMNTASQLREGSIRGAVTAWVIASLFLFVAV